MFYFWTVLADSSIATFADNETTRPVRGRCSTEYDFTPRTPPHSVEHLPLKFELPPQTPRARKKISLTGPTNQGVMKGGVKGGQI